MKGYGSFCPVAKAAEILTERWTLLVLRELLLGSCHFNHLRRGIPQMSPTLLIQAPPDAGMGWAGLAQVRRQRALGVSPDPGRRGTRAHYRRSGPLGAEVGPQPAHTRRSRCR